MNVHFPLSTLTFAATLASVAAKVRVDNGKWTFMAGIDLKGGVRRLRLRWENEKRLYSSGTSGEGSSDEGGTCGAEVFDASAGFSGIERASRSPRSRFRAGLNKSLS